MATISVPEELMIDGLIDSPDTPSSGNCAVYFDTDDNRLKIIDDAGVIHTIETSITSEFQTLAYIWAYGYIEANGANTVVHELTVARTNAGRYTVTFDNAHPNGVNYAVFLTPHEPENTRDGNHIEVSQGTLTANGFSYWIGTGDNGGTADAFVDAPHSIQVINTQDILVRI